MATARSPESLLREGTRRLARVSETARLDCELLLALALGLDRAALYGHAAEELPSGAVERFETLLAERMGGKPLAQIIGRREFHSLEFEITDEVLVPRPETELLVEVVRLRTACEGGKSRILAGDRIVPVAVRTGADLCPIAGRWSSDISHAPLAVFAAQRRRAGAGPVRFVQAPGTVRWTAAASTPSPAIHRTWSPPSAANSPCASSRARHLTAARTASGNCAWRLPGRRRT